MTDLYYATDLIDTFDAAVIGKRDDGKVKIYKKHEQPTRHGGWSGAGWGLATGLGLALFPAAAIGGPPGDDDGRGRRSRRHHRPRRCRHEPE